MQRPNPYIKTEVPDTPKEHVSGPKSKISGSRKTIPTDLGYQQPESFRDRYGNSSSDSSLNNSQLNSQVEMYKSEPQDTFTKAVANADPNSSYESESGLVGNLQMRAIVGNMQRKGKKRSRSSLPVTSQNLAAKNIKKTKQGEANENVNQELGKQTISESQPGLLVQFWGLLRIISTFKYV